LAVGLLLLLSPSAARAKDKDAIITAIAVSSIAGAACIPFAAADGDESDQDYARRTAFVGASLSYVADTFESDLQSSARNETGSNDLTVSIKDSFGAKGRIGYRCHRYASAEVQVEWIESFDGKVFQKGLGRVATVDLEPVIVTANVRGYLPLWQDRLQPFAFFGAGLASVKQTARDKVGQEGRVSERETEIALRVGGGVDFYATPNIVLTLETDYLQAFGSLDDFDYVSMALGLQYRF
jgi:opacity protein-like surface antigen